MSWNTEMELENGVKLAVQSDNGPIPHGYTGGEVVGFFARDEETIQLIHDRDERIFDALAEIVDTIDELSVARWATDPGWWVCEYPHNGIEDYLSDLCVLERSQYATEEQRQEAKETIAGLKEEIARKKKKSEATKRRRSQFSSKYDALVLALIERGDSYCCQECGKSEDLTIDHIVPLSKGGTDDLDNLRWLCRKCNSRKGA